MKTSRRGRPPGYTNKKLAVLGSIADLAVETPKDEFILAEAIRRALKLHGCLVSESTERDYRRSYRKEGVRLLAEARRRRAPPLPAASAGLSGYVRQATQMINRASGHGARFDEKAHLKALGFALEPSPLAEFVRKQVAWQQQMSQSPALKMIHEMQRKQSEWHRMLDSFSAALRPYRHQI